MSSSSPNPYSVISQIRVSTAFKFFEKDVMDKYHLKRYYARDKPCLFYGVVSKDDIQIIMQHEGIKIIVFCGSDSILTKENITKLNKLKNINNTYFIAISSFIEKDLREMDILYQSVPLCITNNIEQFQPITKGQNIYIYTSIVNSKLYGSHIFIPIIEKFPYIGFIIATNPKHYDYNRRYAQGILKNCGTYRTREELINVYKTCFLCLRLTSHDGAASTVYECGLMGIPSVHNGKHPSAIRYRNVADVINIIKEERKKIGTMDRELAERMVEYSTLNPEWLTMKFYTK